MTINIKGEVTVHTGNILPIIKKWLYSEHDIFLRELISNAYDAIVKRHKLSVLNGISDVPTGKIDILIDEATHTLTIRDNGLGMTSEEVQKYINQIAFSGAEEFVKKYQGKDDSSQVIGHFGLGFYSAFMAADTVKIDTLSYQNDAQAVLWTCDGSTEFEIVSSPKTDIGSDVILHLNPDHHTYLKSSEIEALIKKYDNFLPVEICVNGTPVNNQNPLWIKQPSEVTDEEYKAFYSTLFPAQPEPLFWIHLNVDYPFNLKGILYFPKLMHEMDHNRNQVQLYCKQVFVTDHSKEILPEFLTLLRGAIDCPEIPLNVSRSYLQKDPYVQKISKHIVKKVGDKLNELFNKDRDQYNIYWKDIHPFIKYGMMQDADFYEKVKNIVVFASSHSTTLTIPDYIEKNKEKLDHTVLYSTNPKGQASYIALCEDNGLDVIYFDSVIDTHFIQFLESKDSTIKYLEVDSDIQKFISDSTDSKDEATPPATDPSDDALVTVFKTAINQESVKVTTSKIKSNTISAFIQESEYIKRFKAMQRSMMPGQENLFPDDNTLVINLSHPLIDQIRTLSQTEGNTELVNRLCHHVYDLARLNHQSLSGDDLKKFIERSHQLMALTK
jgi:molecular chaperone HtpG